MAVSTTRRNLVISTTLAVFMATAGYLVGRHQQTLISRDELRQEVGLLQDQVNEMMQSVRLLLSSVRRAGSLPAER